MIERSPRIIQNGEILHVEPFEVYQTKSSPSRDFKMNLNEQLNFFKYRASSVIPNDSYFPKNDLYAHKP